jgi:hypothetical protein
MFNIWFHKHSLCIDVPCITALHHISAFRPSSGIKHSLLTYLLLSFQNSRVLLQNLTVDLQVNKFSAFTEPEGSLPSSQEPSADFWLETNGSSPEVDIVT